MEHRTVPILQPEVFQLEGVGRPQTGGLFPGQSWPLSLNSGLRKKQHRMKRKGEASCLEASQMNPLGTFHGVSCNFV